MNPGTETVPELAGQRPALHWIPASVSEFAVRRVGGIYHEVIRLEEEIRIKIKRRRERIAGVGEWC